MIITCAECATQFQLDEARVPETGIRVRCSVCKHAFFVGHPDALDDEICDPVARVVHDILVAEPGAVPEATADLEAPDALTGSGADPEEAGEESWEFGDGGRLSDSGDGDARDRFDESFEAARDAVDDLLGSPWQPPEPSRASIRVGVEEAPPEEFAPPVAIEPSAQGDEFPDELRADDPWESRAWPDREIAPLEERFEGAALPSPQPLASDASFLLGPELRGDDPVPELDEELPDQAEHPLAEAGDSSENEALSDALEGFETAEESDLDPFEAELSDVDLASELGTSELGTSEDWGLDAPSDREELEQDALPALARSEAAVTAALPIDFGAPFELEPRRGRVVAWLAQAGNTLGGGTVAILAAVALWGSIAPRSAPLGASGSQALAGLEAVGVAGRWVENATLGSLYVVSGELHNPGGAAKLAGARLVVRLLDAQGVPVEDRSASLGPPLGAQLLREGRPADLRGMSEAGALALARSVVAPGARIPFEAVILDLPDAAMRFDLATASH